MKTHQNPLFSDETQAHADLTTLESPTLLVDKRRPTGKRLLRDLRRQQTAAQAMADFGHETRIHGLTKGQFSLLDLITSTIDTIGPSHMQISTWTAAKTDVRTCCEWMKAGQILSSRWLVDLTFQRRTPELAHTIRELFGAESIRVAQNHCKLVLLHNDDWRVVIQTSMNLNFNPRFENFTVAHDPDLHAFYGGIFDEVWQRQPRDLASANPYTITKFFISEM